MTETRTLRQFVEKAKSPPYNCIEKVTTIPVIGPHGPEQWIYLKRGDKWIAPLPNIHMDDELTPTQRRSLIAQLNLPALEFGLKIG